MSVAGSSSAPDHSAIAVPAHAMNASPVASPTSADRPRRVLALVRIAVLPVTSTVLNTENRSSSEEERAQDGSCGPRRSTPVGKVPGHALRRRYGPAGGFPAAGSDRAVTATPERESLALLPSGSDAVRTLPVRGTRSVNTTCVDPIPTKPPLGRRSVPLERISGSGNR